MKKTKILIPVYNDWKSVFKLLEEINVQLDGWEADISVVIINEASTEERPVNTSLLKNLKSRPIWEGFITKDKLNSLSKFLCIDNICIGSR